MRLTSSTFESEATSSSFESELTKGIPIIRKSMILYIDKYISGIYDPNIPCSVAIFAANCGIQAFFRA